MTAEAAWKMGADVSANFEHIRQSFDLPEGMVYLDGNSLGPPPRAVAGRIAREIKNHWGEKLVTAWNSAGWIDLPLAVGNQIAKLIGAPQGSVIAGDSTSVNVFKALTSALALAGTRKIILSDTGNFPTDLYVAQGAVRALGQGHEIKIVAPEDVSGAIDESIGVLMLTQVDYRTGRLHDMAALTAKARKNGVITIWDLAHSAGAFPVDIAGSGCEFAVGCGYKYLHGGPGAPAFIYVRPDLAKNIKPALAGWLGHSAPFAFDLDYREAQGVGRMTVGTPPILSMAALHEALKLWEGVDLAALRARSIILSQRFIREVEARCPMLTLASPRDPEMRGSQVSFRHAEGYAVMQALIAHGVIGDFRAPDIIRFGFTPLYISEADVVTAAERLEKIMCGEDWRRPEFSKRSKVT